MRSLKPKRKKLQPAKNMKTRHIEISAADVKPVPLEPIETSFSPLQKHPEGFGQLPLDILENDQEILIVSPIAGVNLDKTEVVITNEVLTIRGERQPHYDSFGFTKGQIYSQECFWGKFSRSVILPANVDANLIEATQKDHVLYIRVPKRMRLKMRILKINS